MTEQDVGNSANLAPIPRRDLARGAGVHSLVTRGLGYLNQAENLHDSVYYYLRGALRFYLAKFDDAMKDFDEAIRLDPKNSQAYRYRAKIWGSWGLRGTAYRDLNEAIRLAPTNALYHCERGTVDPTKAGTRDFDTAIRLDPSLAEAYFHRAIYRGIRLRRLQPFLDQALDVGFLGDGLAKDAARICDVSSFDCLGEFCELAIQDAQTAIRLDPKFADSLREFELAVYHERIRTLQALRLAHKKAHSHADEKV